MHVSTKAANCTAAVTTTRSTFKIEDPSRGPGRVNFRGPDEGFGLEGTPKPKKSAPLGLTNTSAWLALGSY